MASREGKKDAFDRNPAILAIRTRSELAEYVISLFVQEGSADKLGVDPVCLREFVGKVSRNYRKNPYHNFHHAVDTVNTVTWMITRPVLAQGLPTHFRFLLLLSALIHDVGHPGHNNMWEVQTGSDLARKYNNVAVLEKQSYDVLCAILDEPRYDVLDNFDADTRREWMKIVEDVVLATDFAVHRQFLDEFRTYVGEHKPDLANPEYRLWAARAIMKAADIANTSKPFPDAQVWGERVMMEFWAQGVMEKRNNLPVGPLNDPETVQLNAAQAGFIRFAALELFELLSTIEPALTELVDNLRSNLDVYEEMARQSDGYSD